MRIAVIGPQNTGKSTFIKDFLAAFPQYTTPRETYRDVVKAKGLAINQKTNQESQKFIRDFLFEQIVNNNNENILFDRCVIDNLVYTLVQKEKGVIEDDFIAETRTMMKDSLKHLDAILFIPTTVAIALVDDEIRDIDPVFIDQVNRIFLEVLFVLARESSIPIVTVSGSREGRILRVKEHLSL